MDANNSNGINAMMAHTWQSGDDNNFVRGIIGSYMFLGFGVVSNITGERMTVSCGARTYTNVELMVLGVDGWGLKAVPAVNDRVLLLSTQVPVTDLKTFVATGSMPAYDQSGIKAIPITDVKSAQLITVQKTGIQVTGNVKVTVNDAGVKLEDRNGAVIETSASGITVTDNKNKSGNKVNKVVMSSSGVEVDDKNGNKVVMSNSGVEIDDKNSNTIVMSTSGVEIDDKNGNKIVMGQSNVTINGKLQIGRS